MLDKVFSANDQRRWDYEVEIIDLDSGSKRVKKVKADNSENAMQIAVEGYAEWMVGMTTSTLRDYYIKTRNILVKDPNRIVK